MKIKKVKPYFIKKIDTDNEFIQLQKKLFKDGYSWMNGVEIWTNNNFVKYPIYVSNLPFIVDGFEEKNNMIREHFNKYNNDVLFIDNDKSVFNIKLLRFDKLKKISSK